MDGEKTSEEKQKRLHEEVRERTLSFIVGAFGLVAGLAWNEAIKSLIESLFPLGTGTLLIKFAYALFVTIILVLVTIYLGRLFTKKS